MSSKTRTAIAVDTVQQNPAWFSAGLVIAALIVMWWIVSSDAQYDTLNFVPVTYDLVVDILTPIFLIALLVERGLEVFVSTGRKLGRSDHERKQQDATTLIAQIKERIRIDEGQLNAPGAANLTPQERQIILDRLAAANVELKAAEDTLRAVVGDMDQYRAETARITFVVGAFIGLIIGLAGVRVIAPLVDFKLAEWGDFQRFVFHSLDVVLTAGLLAGGANGVHQIIGVFADFTESTRRKAKTS